MAAATPCFPQSTPIDSFETSQVTLNLTYPPAGQAVSATAVGPGILGGERDLGIGLLAGTVGGNGIAASVASGFFSLALDPTISGEVVIQWDGADGDPTSLDPIGLGGVDLTNGGAQSAVALGLLFDDTPVDTAIQVYTNAANSSRAALRFPGQVYSQMEYVVPFSAFVPTAGAGADFANVGAVVLTINSSKAPDIVLDHVSTAALLTARNTDTLLTDNDADGKADPGDTVRYTVVIENPADSFHATVAAAAFSCNPDPNTRLAAGSVSATQGAVASGNSGGDTSVAVDIGDIADGAGVTISFEAAVNNPLPAGVAELFCQGLVHAASITAQPTDDPDTGAVNDPTATTVFATPGFNATGGAALLADNDGDGRVDPGDVLRYTAAIANVGDRDAAGVVFTSSMDPNVLLQVGSATSTLGTVARGNGPGDTSVAVEVGTMAGAGGSAAIAFDVAVRNPFPAGPLEVAWQGLVAGGNFPDTPAPASPLITPVTAAPAIAAAKTETLLVDQDNDGRADPGDTLQYSIAVGNSGDQHASGATLADTPDPNTTLVVGSVTTTQGSVSSGNGAGNTIVQVNLGTVAGGGGTATVGFQTLVDNPLPAGVSSVSNQGRITGNNFPETPTDDPGTPAPRDAKITPVTSAPLVAASKRAVLAIDQDGDGRADPGDILQYTITISNTGDQDASAATFADTPDPNTTLVAGSVSATRGIVCGGNEPGDRAVAVDIGTIAGNGASAVIAFRTAVNDPLPVCVTSVSNQGLATGGNFPPTRTNDPGGGGPEHPTVTPVVPTPLQIRVDPLVMPFGERDIGDGPTAPWRLTISNDGATTLSVGAVAIGPLAPFALDQSQAVPPSGSAKKGLGVAVLNEAQTQLDVAIVHDIGSPSSGAICRGAPGSAGPQVRAIPHADNPIRTAWAISPGSLGDLLGGNLYVNLATADYPAGEIRGQIVASSAQSSEFHVVSDSGEAVLGPGSSRRVEVDFDPASVGLKSTALRIFSNDSDEPVVSVWLEGLGVQYQGPPIITWAHDNGDAAISATWINPNEIPWAILALTYDIYVEDWVVFDQFDGPFYWLPETATTATLPVRFSGGYHAWVANLYPDMAWFFSPNPWAGVVYSGIPHLPLDVAAEDRGGGHVRLTWRPDLYGSWQEQIIVYKAGEGFIPAAGPCDIYPGFSPWTFIDYCEFAYDPSRASYFDGWADFTLPGPGEYWFMIRAMGWVGPSYAAGDFAYAYIRLD